MTQRVADTRPPLPMPTMASQSREAQRPPAKASCESQRRQFEKLLKRDEDKDEEASPEAGKPWPEPGMTGHHWLASEGDDTGGGGDASGRHDGGLAHGGHAAGLDGRGETACGLAPLPSAQTELYPHMALPHGEAALRRFEVLGGHGLSSVEISAQANGITTVTMAAQAEHAALLDRYLPKLQRRLPERVTTHMRVQEHDHSHEHHDDEE